MHLKVVYKWPIVCIDAMWKLLKDDFSDGVNLPDSHYESKTKLGKHWGRCCNRFMCNKFKAGNSYTVFL